MLKSQIGNSKFDWINYVWLIRFGNRGAEIGISNHFVKAHLGMDLIISENIHKVWTNQKPDILALALSKSDCLNFIEL